MIFNGFKWIFVAQWICAAQESSTPIYLHFFINVAENLPKATNSTNQAFIKTMHLALSVDV